MEQHYYDNMFKTLKEFAKETEKWSLERKHRAEETVRVFDALLSQATKVKPKE